MWALLNRIFTHAECLLPQNLLSFQCGSEALGAQNKAFSFLVQVQQAALLQAQVPTSAASPSPTATFHLHNGVFLQQPSQGIHWWRGKVADTYHPRTHSYLLKLRDWWPLDHHQHPRWIEVKGELKRDSSKSCWHLIPPLPYSFVLTMSRISKLIQKLYSKSHVYGMIGHKVRQVES